MNVIYKPFYLQILTPERVFFEGDVEVFTADAPDGKISFLAGHTPLITPVEVGTLNFKTKDGWVEAFSSSGFMEVTSDGVFVFVQACESPDEIDTRRAEEARYRAEEHMRQRQSTAEYKQSKIALARAMTRLQVTKSRRK